MSSVFINALFLPTRVTGGSTALLVGVNIIIVLRNALFVRHLNQNLMSLTGIALSLLVL